MSWAPNYEPFPKASNGSEYNRRYSGVFQVSLGSILRKQIVFQCVEISIHKRGCLNPKTSFAATLQIWVKKLFERNILP